MSTKEGVHGQPDANTQSPVAQYFSGVFHAELGCLVLQNTSMTSGVVVPKAPGDDLAGRAFDDIKDVVTGWFDDVYRGKRRGNHVRLLEELGRGLLSTCAQSVENGDALGD